METTRLETFADGVFAIAATLLIIEVAAIAVFYVFENAIFGRD